MNDYFKYYFESAYDERCQHSVKEEQIQNQLNDLRVNLHQFEKKSKDIIKLKEEIQQTEEKHSLEEETIQNQINDFKEIYQNTLNLKTINENKIKIKKDSLE